MNLRIEGTEAFAAELSRRIVEGVTAMRDEARREVEPIYADAVARWPVRTGASKQRLRWIVTVKPEEIEARVWHDTTPQTAYTRFIRIGGGPGSPVRREYRTVVVRRGNTTYTRRQLVRVRDTNPPKYAVTEYLGRPWRAMVPRLMDRWVALFAEALSDK